MPDIYNLPFTPSAYAEIQTYEGIGEYLMSDAETPEFAKEGAKIHALRNAQEQAGVFISSLTEVKDHIVNKDEIKTFIAGIVKVSDIRYKPVPLNDDGGYIKFIATVKVTFETDDLNKSITQWLSQKAEDRSTLIEQNKSLQKIIDDQAKRIKELEQAAVDVKTQAEKAEVNKKIKIIDNQTTYIQKIEQSDKLWNKSKSNGAIEVLTEAIKIDPNNPIAYQRRAKNYIQIKYGFEKGVADINETIRLSPNDADVFCEAGNFYHTVYVLARIKRFLKNPDLLADVEPSIDLLNKAIECYDKAIEINSNYSKAYIGRSIIYSNFISFEHQNSYRKLWYDDLKTALELEPNDDETNFLMASYYNHTYNHMGSFDNLREAVKYCTKAIQVNPNDARYYHLRAECYEYLSEKAKSDKVKAKKLGWK